MKFKPWINLEICCKFDTIYVKLKKLSTYATNMHNFFAVKY